ncbi:predicted protein [Candida tropicalis MYA-3404]|uniref:Uncharacterized protein n=1 Tax=Candida tropicalis (strain ATCC MYA-3404 / T1) TaxID=294747 RepID=C5M633_CANTT|nr:predicted protein [Candida tropicalis MYA-3404]EER34453.1 predicted protein [Candida tropicalis MYA-3404]KAG4408327.1 hypothetical protein JTP64_001633 [Candida tropicalis]
MIQDIFSTYPYFMVNLIISLILILNHIIRRNYQLGLLIIWNLIIISYTPVHSISLDHLPVYDSQILLTFLTSIIVSYTCLKQENKKSIFDKFTYPLTFIIVFILLLAFLPQEMLLSSTATIKDQIKFDHVFIALTVTYLIDAFSKFAFLSDFPTVLVQGIWTYNAIVLVISMWFMIYSKDTLVNILTIMENGADRQDASFVTSVIISNLNQLEQDYKICSQGATLFQECLQERNMDNLQTTYQIAKIMAINCWSILNLFLFVLIPSIIAVVYRRRQMFEEHKEEDLEEKVESGV